MSIRAWLILLVVSAIFPLVVYGLLNAVQSYRDQRAQIVASTARAAEGLGRATERFLEQQMVGLEALAGAPALQTGDFAGFAPLASYYLARIAPGGRLLVSDAEGNVHFVIADKTAADYGRKLFRRSRPDLSRAVFATGRPSVSGLVRSAQTDQYRIAIDTPVLRDGSVVADLTLSLPVSRLQDIIAGRQLPPDWTAVITASDGTLLARMPALPDPAGHPYTADTVRFLPSGEESQTVETNRLDGTPVIGAVTRTRQFGWLVGVAVPRNLMFAPLRHSIFRLVAVGGAALGLSLLLALFVARKLSRPITALAETAARFDQSGLVPPSPRPALREADEVARVLASSMRRRRDAEDAANEAELRATRVIEDVPCGVVLFGPDGAWRFVNQAACDLLGRPAEELMGMTISSADLDVRDANGEPIPVERRSSARALRGETVRGLEVSMRRGDGRRAHMIFNSAPLLDREGRITGALTAMLDISDRRAADEQLAKVLQTLEIRVEEEVAAREAAQAAASQAQKMQALGQLAGGVAHDFNNVLQTIAGAVSLVEKRADNPDAVRRFAKTIASAADRGASVTGRLLAFARRGDLTPAPIETAALLADLREILVHTLGSGVTVAIEIDPDTGWLLADRAQLETALVNLATNARDAMPEGGTLTLRAHPEVVRAGERHRAGLAPGSYVRLDVEDTGTGMDAGTLRRATEPFFTTKPINKGTGLGLAMVRGFAEQLDGGMAISSTVGRGTSVALWLPATAPRPAARPERTSPAPACRSSGVRILLVDDEPEIRSVLAEELSDHGWVVEQASCGQEAIELLRESRFDVLVADQSMPGESGITLIGLARRLRTGLPAILLTGLAPEIGAELTETPAEAAITELAGKPIRPKELARRIDALLARAGAPPQ